MLRNAQTRIQEIIRIVLCPVRNRSLSVRWHGGSRPFRRPDRRQHRTSTWINARNCSGRRQVAYSSLSCCHRCSTAGTGMPIAGSRHRATCGVDPSPRPSAIFSCQNRCAQLQLANWAKARTGQHRTENVARQNRVRRRCRPRRKRRHMTGLERLSQTAWRPPNTRCAELSRVGFMSLPWEKEPGGQTGRSQAESASLEQALTF